MTRFKYPSPLSRLGLLLAIFVIAIVTALLWFALSKPQPAPGAAAQEPARPPARQAADGRYVACPAGSGPKADQPHICVPDGF